MKTLLAVLFYFIFIFIVRKILGSLLSRLKNRYEYLPQENSIDLLTEDLYDFEFTNMLTTSTQKVSYKSTYPYEELYYISPHKESLEDTDRSGTIAYIRNRMSRPYKKSYESHVTTSDFLFIPRPTISSSLETKLTLTPKHRKTFQTHFPKINIRTTKSLVVETKNTSISIISKPTRTKVKTMKPTFLFDLIYKLKDNTSNISSTDSITTLKELSTTDKWTTKTNTTEYLNNITSTTNGITTSLNSLGRESNIKSSCYYCGLNFTKLPMPFCHKVFDAGDQRLSRRRHRLKIKCIGASSTYRVKNVYYSPFYRGGCFKRYLDVGTAYSERGCRQNKPETGKSYASIRLAKLEMLLNNEEEGCIASPEASLTPFSRAVSLYVRYHVCVCNTKYCNHSSIVNCISFHYLLLFLFTMQYNNYLLM